eukprot:2511817-Amphidinium_carterae.1
MEERVAGLEQALRDTIQELAKTKTELQQNQQALLAQQVQAQAQQAQQQQALPGATGAQGHHGGPLVDTKILTKP